MTTLLLIHSPLVGPFTWELVAREIEQRGGCAVVPALPDTRGTSVPTWQAGVLAARTALLGTSPGEPVVVVGHSGAGPVLHAFGAAVAGGRPAAYLFTDAGIPSDGTTRLEQLRREAPQFARQLEERFAAGSRFPEWTDADLRAVLPDASMRDRMLAEMRPQDAEFWDEALPPLAAWPDAPCGYLQFTASYEPAAQEARRAGWAYRRLDGGHFQMLVDPPAVAAALLDLTHTLGVPAPAGMRR